MIAQIALPASVDRLALFRPFTLMEQRQGEWLASWEVNGDYRRQITRYSPLRFALVYFPHLLRSPETGDRTSLAEHHVAMAQAAASWARPGRHRDAWVAPRGAAKTTWWAILILWSLAHGHRRLALVLSDASDQARLPMATIRREIASNRLFVADFPDMAPPERGARGSRDSQDNYTAAGGAVIAVRGMNAAKLGLNIGGARPDLIVLDDIEPDASNYSPEARRKRLETVLNAVLPMNEQAAVVLSGTVTMYGSIMHAVVRKARGIGVQEPWIDDEGFRVHYVPAIRVAQDGTERSFWEQRYPLAYLDSIRHTLNYALNFDGWPPLPGGHHWRRELFRYGHLVAGTPLVLQLDPAPTAGPTSDMTGMVVGGYRDIPGRQAAVVIMHASAFRDTPGRLAARVDAHLRQHPDIRLVRVEGNQGSELWRGVLEPVCRRHGVELDIHPSGSMPKLDRVAQALAWTEEGKVEHDHRLPVVETDLIQWPELEHDDLVDAYAHLVRYYLEDGELAASQRRIAQAKAR
jgi:hypothetical protein